MTGESEPASLPSPAASPVPGAAEDFWALACYVPLCGAGFVACVVAFVTVGRRRPRLRFHALQGIFLSLAAVAAAIAPWLGAHALETAGLPSFGVAAVLVQLSGVGAVLVASVWLMAASYHRRDAALPLVGALARRWSGYASS